MVKERQKRQTVGVADGKSPRRCTSSKKTEQYKVKKGRSKSRQKEQGKMLKAQGQAREDVDDAEGKSRICGRKGRKRQAVEGTADESSRRCARSKKAEQ